jgi:hypothetical protein
MWLILSFLYRFNSSNPELGIYVRNRKKLERSEVRETFPSWGGKGRYSFHDLVTYAPDIENICDEIVEFQRTGRFHLKYMKKDELGCKKVVRVKIPASKTFKGIK